MTAGRTGPQGVRDHAEISGVLLDFLDGLYTCDTVLLSRVLHPAALYATAVDGELLTRTMDVYLPVVAARESGASRGDVRDEQVVSIEIVAPSIALAVVSSVMAGVSYVDALTLVRVADRWHILSKVFHATTKAA